MSTPTLLNSLVGKRSVMPTLAEKTFDPPPLIEKGPVLNIGGDGRVSVFSGGSINGKPVTDDPDLFVKRSAAFPIIGSTNTETADLSTQAWISRGLGMIIGVVRSPGASIFTTIST